MQNQLILVFVIFMGLGRAAKRERRRVKMRALKLGVSPSNMGAQNWDSFRHYGRETYRPPRFGSRNQPGFCTLARRAEYECRNQSTEMLKTEAPLEEIISPGPGIWNTTRGTRSEGPD